MTGEVSREPQFSPATTREPCQSCAERELQGYDALRYMHRPRRMMFAFHPKGEVKCEECGGTQAVPTAPRPDPYDLTARESRDALERVRQWQLRTPQVATGPACV